MIVSSSAGRLSGSHVRLCAVYGEGTNDVCLDLRCMLLCKGVFFVVMGCDWRGWKKIGFGFGRGG